MHKFVRWIFLYELLPRLHVRPLLCLHLPNNGGYDSATLELVHLAAVYFLPVCGITHQNRVPLIEKAHIIHLAVFRSSYTANAPGVVGACGVNQANIVRHQYAQGFPLVAAHAVKGIASAHDL